MNVVDVPYNYPVHLNIKNINCNTVEEVTNGFKKSFPLLVDPFRSVQKL